MEQVLSLDDVLGPAPAASAQGPATLSIDDVLETGPAVPASSSEAVGAETQQQRPEPTMSRPYSAAMALTQGAYDVPAQVLKSQGVADFERRQERLRMYDAIDDGRSIDDAAGLIERPELPLENLKLEAARYKLGSEHMRRMLREDALAGFRNLPGFKAGQALQDAIRQISPSDPAYEGDFLTDTLPRGIGSTVGFAATGAGGRLLRAPPTLTTAVIGAEVARASQFEDAINSGASFADAFEASDLSAIVGTSEAVPIARWFDRLDRSTGGGIRRVVKEAMKQGTEEALQEAFQAVSDNLITSTFVGYDEERGTFVGVGESAGTGFTAGALLTAMAHIIVGRRASRQTREQLDRVEPTLEETAAEQPSADVVSIDDVLGPVEQPGTGTPPATGEPVGPAEPSPAPPTTTAPAADDTATGDVVVTPRGRRVPVNYEVVDAGQLVTSHTDDLAQNPAFPQELQPRDRTRAASAEQIANIAANLEPELLGRSANAADGAPIVGPDNIVESGNARVLALRRAYQTGPVNSQRYRDFLSAQGFDVGEMAAPVLVRRRTGELTPAERAEFAREANERTTLDVAPAETASTDATALPAELLEQYQGGDIASAGNRAFVRGFLDRVVSPGERARLVTSEGALSQDGVRRIENALFARAYHSPDLLAALREDTDSNVKAIGGAMIDAAPAWAQMRERAAGGLIPDRLDITADLREAVALVRRARQQGVPLTDLIGQQDAFNPASPETAAILRTMFNDSGLRRPASRQKITETLRRYAQEAGKADASPALIQDLPPVTPIAILEAVAEPQGTLAEPVMTGTAGQRRPDRPAAVTPPERAPQATLSIDDVIGPDTRRASARAFEPGPNYVGFRRPEAATGSRKSAGAVRREDILGRFARDLGVPIYQGRVRGKRMLGFFRPHLEEVRNRNFNDLETSAHEMAHLLDDRYPAIRKQWHPATKANKTVRTELSGVSYDRGKLYEGFAEFVRLWMTQPDMAAQKVPTFQAWWEGTFLPSEPAVQRAMNRAREGMIAWYQQDAVQRLASKQGLNTNISRTLNDVRGRFREQVFDDLNGFRLMEQDMTGRIQPGGLYETARVTRGAGAVVLGTLETGVPVYDPKTGDIRYEGDGLVKILDQVAGDLDNFWLYAIARSANELRAQGRERLFDKTEIDAGLRLETPAFAATFENLQDWFNGLADFGQATGIIDPEARARWRRTQYMPFYRALDPDSELQPTQRAGGIEGNWNGIRALTGGTANLNDMSKNVVQHARMIVEAGFINLARQEAAKVARLRGGARYMVRIPPEDRRVTVPGQQIEAKLLGNLGLTRDMLPFLPVEAQQMIDAMLSGIKTWENLFVVNQPPKQGGPEAGIVAVLHGGKPTYYQVADPMLYRGFQMLKRKPRGALMQILSFPRLVKQIGITLTPDFMGPNFFRDTVMSTFMTRAGYKFGISAIKGLVHRVRKDPVYQAYMANGGGMSSHMVDPALLNRQLRRFYTSRGIDYRKVIDVVVSPVDALRMIGDATEMASRLGEFGRVYEANKRYFDLDAELQDAIARNDHKAIRKLDRERTRILKGADNDVRNLSLRHAAYLGREITTDYSMRGGSEAINFLYDTVVFLKAAMNSWDRLYRGLSEDPNRGAIGVKIGLLALLSAALYLINRDNPLYDDLEDWDRDLHWHFYVPNERYFEFVDKEGRPPRTHEEAQGRYTHLMLPKIWEIGAIASSAERAVEGYLAGAPAETAAHVGRVFLQTFQIEYVPQFAAPLYELAINRNRFTDRPIETLSMKNVEPWLRSGPYTNRTLTELGLLIGANDVPVLKDIYSPAKVESLARGIFGTWGAYGLMGVDAARYDDQPEMRWDQYPAIRRFFQSTDPARRSKVVTQFWDFAQEATEARRTVRALVKRGHPEIAERKAREPEAQLGDFAGKAVKRMGSINRFSRAVSSSRNLAGTQQLAEAWGTSTGRNEQVAEWQRTTTWNDLQALKRAVLDDVQRVRQQFAAGTMRNVETARERLAQ